MNRGLVLGALVVTGALSAAFGAATQSRAGVQQAPSAADIHVDKIRDNLYVFGGGGGNTAALVAADGVVLVDTMLPGWGKPIMDRLREITEKPVTTIINTHTHFDHVGGNVEFPATIDVVAQETTAKLMKEMRPVTGGPDQPHLFEDSHGRGLPTRTFKDRMTLGRGTDRIELRYFGRAHTGGDAWVVFPALRVLHTGDVFGFKGVPLLDANNGGSGVEYAGTMDKAIAGLPKNIDTVITGHHPATQTMANLRTHRDFVRDFVRAVQTAKRTGQTMDDFIKAYTVPERYVKEGYALQPQLRPLRPDVEVIWNETK